LDLAGFPNRVLARFTDMSPLFPLQNVKEHPSSFSLSQILPLLDGNSSVDIQEISNVFAPTRFSLGFDAWRALLLGA
jgi:hypothetical protein